jgi:hypothetical protein
MKRVLFLNIALIAIWPSFGRCGEPLIQHLPANRIERGCSLNLYAVESEKVAIGRSDRALDLRWSCAGEELKTIDTYQINGGSPQVVTILYRKNRNIIVLVKWETRSRGADLFGDSYKIYAYRYMSINGNKSFSVNRNIMNKLGEGLEGDMDGRPVHFPYKDAAAIRKVLDRLGY